MKLCTRIVQKDSSDIDFQIILLNCRVSKNGWREDAYYYNSKVVEEKARITLHEILEKEVI